MTHASSPSLGRLSTALLHATALIAMLGCSATAQLGSPSKAMIQSDADRTYVSFEDAFAHTIIPVSINGNEPVPIVFDTGMPADGAFLYGSPTVDALSLSYSPMQAQIGGAGSGAEPIFARIATDQELVTGDVRITGANLIVAPPMPSMGGHHAGIVGYSLFRRFVVHFDHDANKVGFIEPESFVVPEGAVEIPIRLIGNIPYAKIAVVTEDGSRIPIEVVVDTGASHPISLNAGTAPGLVLPDDAIESVLGRGLSGEIHGHAGRVAGIDLGGLVVKNVVATFPEESHQNPRGIDSLNGNLGNALLQRFQVWFDYTNLRMVLAPGTSRNDPFEWDMSGLHVVPQGDGQYKIAGVIEGSAGAVAGIKKGDHLLRWNGETIEEIGFTAVREGLRTHGTEPSVGLLRDGEEITVRLTLKRRI